VNNESILTAIASIAAAGDLAYTEHFHEREVDPLRPAKTDIVALLCDQDSGVIERYEDRRGSLILVWGRVEGRVGHVLVTFPPDPLVVTACCPDLHPHRWTDAYRRRVR
jgi:hypothetical protein